MPRLLIIDQHQFGTLTDTYKYCVHLRRDHTITFVCWDYGAPRVEVEGVQVRYVSRAGPRPFRLARFIAAAIRQLVRKEADIVFVVYFLGCSLLLPFRGGRPAVADIRTGSVRQGWLRRTFDDAMLRLEVLWYPRVTVISESLRERLHLHGNRVHLLPLGADRQDPGERSFDSLRLLYIGTLEHREMHRTIDGFTAFCEDRGPDIDATYDLLGNGPPHDRGLLEEAIRRSSQRERIRFHGSIPVTRLGPYLASSNVGVAFIPLRDHYHVQPATKVFEYLLAGIPVLATRTRENLRVINDTNGVLCEDSAESFREALHELWRRRKTFDSPAIRDSASPYEWNTLIDRYLRPLLAGLPDGKGQ